MLDPGIAPGSPIVPRTSKYRQRAGNLLPDDPLKVVQKPGTLGHVGTVANGVNGSLICAAATIRFSMVLNGLTQLAKQSNPHHWRRPAQGADTVAPSKPTCALLWQNILLAVGTKAVLLVLAVFGSATVLLAVFFVDKGASSLGDAHRKALVERDQDVACLSARLPDLREQGGTQLRRRPAGPLYRHLPDSLLTRG